MGERKVWRGGEEWEGEEEGGRGSIRWVWIVAYRRVSWKRRVGRSGDGGSSCNGLRRQASRLMDPCSFRKALGICATRASMPSPSFQNPAISRPPDFASRPKTVLPLSFVRRIREFEAIVSPNRRETVRCCLPGSRSEKYLTLRAEDIHYVFG